MEKVQFIDPETGDVVEFFVLEQTTINGIAYLLVTEDEEGDSDAYIMKDLSAETDTEAAYVMVEEDEELEYISRIFAEMLEDVTFEK